MQIDLFYWIMCAVGVILTLINLSLYDWDVEAFLKGEE